MLRTPELKPFIVYVRPPPFDVLKETRHQVDISVVKYSWGKAEKAKYENILVAFLLIDQLNHHCDQYVFTCLLFLYLSIFLGDLNMINTTIIISHMHLHYNHNNDHNRRMLGQPLMRQILAPLPTMSSGI